MAKQKAADNLQEAALIPITVVNNMGEFPAVVYAPNFQIAAKAFIENGWLPVILKGDREAVVFRGSTNMLINGDASLGLPSAERQASGLIVPR